MADNVTPEDALPADTGPDNGSPAAAYEPPLPFEMSMESWTSGAPEDWANTVAVRVVTAWDSRQEEDQGQVEADAQAGYADLADQHELVEIDTNYKATREGPHPVRLTRPDAVEVAAHMLTGVEDTFHYGRRGRLRAGEAAELLHALDAVDAALANLRSHALSDLLEDTGIQD